MDNKIVQVIEAIPAIAKITHLDFSLSGWPAAATALAFFGSCALIHTLKIAHPKNNENI